MILWELFLIFALARLAGEIMTRLGQPAVVGEILVGVAIGGHALGWVHQSEVLEAIAELGVVFLLFEVGLENRFSDLRAVGGTSTAVALSGVAVPFAAGAGLFLLLDHPMNESLFVGAAMVATSVGVTARVLTELGVLKRRESQIVLGAAVIDDVLGLLILAVVTGSRSSGGLISLAVVAVLFVVFVTAVGTRVVRGGASFVGRLKLREGSFAVSVAICLGLSALAGRIGLAAIIGAFLAGMILAETKEQFELEKSVEPVTNLLAPFFFVLTGMAVNARALADPGVAALAAGVVVVAIASKLLPCWAASRSAVVGVGMVPRGEVGIVVASLGLESGVVGADVYAVVVAMAVLTTIVVPPALKVLYR